jgi:hypothetical protein
MTRDAISTEALAKAKSMVGRTRNTYSISRRLVRRSSLTDCWHRATTSQSSVSGKALRLRPKGERLWSRNGRSLLRNEGRSQSCKVSGNEGTTLRPS